MVNWVQTMREKLTKTKAAGFDHKGTFISRRMSKKDNPSSMREDSNDKNKIKVPEQLANKVISEGMIDYKPKIGDQSQVI